MRVSKHYQVNETKTEDCNIVEMGFDFENRECSVDDLIYDLTQDTFELCHSGREITVGDYFTSDYEMDLHTGDVSTVTFHIDDATPAELLELVAKFKELK